MKQVRIQNSDIFLKTYNGQKVLTFWDVDAANCLVKGSTRRKFLSSKSKMAEGEDYFKISSQEFRKIAGETDFSKVGKKRVIYLLTLNGYLALARNSSDVFLYETQRDFVQKYFTDNKDNMEQCHNQEIASVDRCIESIVHGVMDKIITPSILDLERKVSHLQKELHITDEYDQNDPVSDTVLSEDERNLKRVKVLGNTNNIFIDFMSGNYNIEETDLSEEEQDVKVMKELVTMLADGFKDHSPNKSATYRRIYSAMDIDWEQRRNKYKQTNPWTLTKPSKLALVKKDEKLRKLFIQTAQSMAEVC